jgi:hypothetical protein
MILLAAGRIREDRTTAYRCVAMLIRCLQMMYESRPIAYAVHSFTVPSRSLGAITPFDRRGTSEVGTFELRIGCCELNWNRPRSKANTMAGRYYKVLKNELGTVV